MVLRLYRGDRQLVEAKRWVAQYRDDATGRIRDCPQDTLMDPDLESLHHQSIFNRPAILAAQQVGCFCCVRVFGPEAVTRWTDSGRTGLCPHCAVDSLLPGCSDLSVLKALCAKWFTPAGRWKAS